MGYRVISFLGSADWPATAKLVRTSEECVIVS